MLTRPPTTRTAEAVQGRDSGTDGARAAGLAKQHAQIANLRDINADIRDGLAARRDAAATNLGESSAIAELRRDAAADRASAAGDRQQAAADRRLASAAGLQASEEKAQASVDRRRATSDSRQAAKDLRHAQHDDLTGVYSRELGEIALRNEISRAQRSGESFVLGFVDVDGLKELNDRDGHAAGDSLLQHVVASLKHTLRSYDPIVRLGGDEFLCGFSNTSLRTSQRRIRQIQAAVAKGPHAGSVTVGLAKLHPDDTLEALTARADADMYAHKPRAGRRTNAHRVGPPVNPSRERPPTGKPSPRRRLTNMIRQRA